MVPLDTAEEGHRKADRDNILEMSMGLLLVNHPQLFILSSLHLRHLEIRMSLALSRTVTLKPL